MTKEELKKEAEEKLPQVELDYCHGFMNPCEPNELPYIELVRFRTGFERGYLASAEPREKQIQIDAEQILALQKQNGELTDKVKELEIENEQIKNSDTLCKLIGEQKRKITDLKVQNEQMRCCGNCEWKAKGVCNGNDTCGLKEWKLSETRR